ncbi:hypothetical protein D3C81_2044960 [compost metagenome]
MVTHLSVCEHKRAEQNEANDRHNQQIRYNLLQPGMQHHPDHRLQLPVINRKSTYTVHPCIRERSHPSTEKGHNYRYNIDDIGSACSRLAEHADENGE